MKQHYITHSMFKNVVFYNNHPQSRTFSTTVPHRKGTLATVPLLAAVFCLPLCAFNREA